jgi:hypothetical protein
MGTSTIINTKIFQIIRKKYGNLSIIRKKIFSLNYKERKKNDYINHGKSAGNLSIMGKKRNTGIYDHLKGKHIMG